MNKKIHTHLSVRVDFLEKTFLSAYGRGRALFPDFTLFFRSFTIFVELSDLMI